MIHLLGSDARLFLRACAKRRRQNQRYGFKHDDQTSNWHMDLRHSRGEAPLSNIQAPEKPKTSISNAARLEFGDSKFFWNLELGIWSFGSQPDGVPRIKAARRTIGSLPARCPFAGVAVVRRRIKSQSGDHGESVTLARVDGDPITATAFAVAAELGRAHWRSDQTCCAERIGNRAGTIVTVIIT